MAYHREKADGADVNAATIHGAKTIPVDLGTGVLTVMHIHSGIDQCKKRLALRQQLQPSYDYQQGDERMRVTLLARHGRRMPHERADFSFRVPVDIDMMDDTSSNFRMSAVTESIARQHGYATPNDMRQSLGFKKGEDGLLFLYRLLAPVIGENDLNAAHDRSKLCRAAYEAFRGAKGDKIVINPRTGTLRESKEHSIRRARDQLSTLPRTAALIAEASITPRAHLEQTQLTPFAAEPQEVSRSRAPLLERAMGRLNLAHQRLKDEADPHQRSRLKRHAMKLHEAVLRLATPKLVPAEVAALRQHVPAPEKKAAKKPTTKKTQKLAADVTYTTEFGKRGQYTDAVKRPQKPAAPRLSARERRAVGQAQFDKRKEKDMLLRAAFDNGDIADMTVPLPQIDPVMPSKIVTQAMLEEQLCNHLIEERVPLDVPLTTEDWLNLPSSGTGKGR